MLASARNPPVNDNAEFFEVNILDHAVFLAHPLPNDVNKGIGKKYIILLTTLSGQVRKESMKHTDTVTGGDLNYND